MGDKRFESSLKFEVPTEVGSDPRPSPSILAAVAGVAAAGAAAEPAGAPAVSATEDTAADDAVVARNSSAVAAAAINLSDYGNDRVNGNGEPSPVATVVASGSSNLGNDVAVNVDGINMSVIDGREPPAITVAPAVVSDRSAVSATPADDALVDDGNSSNATPGGANSMDPPTTLDVHIWNREEREILPGRRAIRMAIADQPRAAVVAAGPDTSTGSQPVGIINVSDTVTDDTPDPNDDIAFDGDDIELGDDVGGAQQAPAATSESATRPAAAPRLSATPSGPSAVAKIIEAITALVDESTQNVDTVPEPEAMPSVHARKPISSRLRDSIKRKALEKGVTWSDADVDEIAATRTVQPGKGGQRLLPKWGSPFSPDVVAWRGDRTLHDLIRDALKGIRNDGGTLGPLKAYEKIVLAADPSISPQVANAIATAIEAKISRRIFEIRCLQVAVMNLLWAEIARLEGLPLHTLKFFKVRGD
jgi:hypothetical protein